MNVSAHKQINKQIYGEFQILLTDICFEPDQSQISCKSTGFLHGFKTGGGNPDTSFGPSIVYWRP